MTRGTIIAYYPKEGSGYINPDKEEDRIPFDRKSLLNFAEDEHPRVGDRVTFQVEGGMAGLWATHVRRIDEAGST